MTQSSFPDLYSKDVERNRLKQVNEIFAIKRKTFLPTLPDIRVYSQGSGGRIFYAFFVPQLTQICEAGPGYLVFLIYWYILVYIGIYWYILVYIGLYVLLNGRKAYTYLILNLL